LTAAWAAKTKITPLIILSAAIHSWLCRTVIMKTRQVHNKQLQGFCSLSWPECMQDMRLCSQSRQKSFMQGNRRPIWLTLLSTTLPILQK
jgi:hypothetical protein